MIDKLIKRLRNKSIMAHDGIPILYVVYKPQKDGKNVFTYIADPELGQDKELDYLFKTVADRVREYCADKPDELEEILEIVRKENT